MKIVIQRVKEAKVKIENITHSSIASGLLVFLGIAPEDTEHEIQWMTGKVLRLRLFEDEDHKMNQSVQDIKGEILVVSQFTLYADCKKGNRPSFTNAAIPDKAIPLYNQFISSLEEQLPGKIQSGVFGTDMDISLINDGPVTIILDTQKDTRNRL